MQDHSHYIFVDQTASGGASWGAEALLRTKIEKAFGVMNKLPVVHVVIGGGLGTLDTVCEALWSVRICRVCRWPWHCESVRRFAHMAL